MLKSKLRDYAIVGARERLRELEGERETILRAFPELGGSRSVTKRGRRKMSAAARKAISQRMKKYWSGRKGNKKR